MNKMRFSHSRVETHEKCSFKYWMRYVEGIKTLPDDSPDNALFLGTAMHTGLDKGAEAAVNEYFGFYPIITDQHVNEAMKLEVLIPKAMKLLPSGEFEVKVEDADFIGFLDFLAPVKGFHESEVPGLYDLYDFKYSNNVNNYMDSPQLHLYKYYFEKLNPGKKIRNLQYLFIPKVNIKQKNGESLERFRKRILDELKDAEPTVVPVEYDLNKVLNYMFSVKAVLEAKDFPKCPSYLCRYCEYETYCMKGEDYMLLPKNERRNIEKIEKKVVWLYGSPFSGKTTFANKFPEPLMLNTDGNIKFVDAPFLSIKDEITLNGRMTNRKLAWQVFKDIIAELEKKDNTFKTIIVDLLEDTYEYCRLFMYDQMGITHESDDSFRAWDKVRTEFLSTLKRLMALDYENIILISHEDTSKDITKKGGDKITSIKPNLQEKTSNKVAGMVDIVARVIADDNKRILSFKTNEVIFGGGRLTTKTNEIDLNYDAFLQVYDEANKAAVSKMKGEEPTPKTSTRTSRKQSEKVDQANTPPAPEKTNTDENMSSEEVNKCSVCGEPQFETPSGMTCKNGHGGADASLEAKNFSKEVQEIEPETKTAPTQDAPATRTRKRRGE